MKRKTDIGVKIDYQFEYQKIQSAARGVDADFRRAMFKDFYKRIAKAADQRLVELERLSKKENFKDVTEWAYAKAQRDIRAMFGEDAKRFNRKIPDNLNSIYKDINRVLNFLNAPTSSASGIAEIYDKKSKTLNETYGVNVNWSTTEALFESILWKKTGAKKGSGSVLKAIGVIQSNKRDVRRALKEHKPISIIVPPDEKTGKKDVNVQYEVNRLLRYYKTDLDKLLNKI